MTYEEIVAKVAKEFSAADVSNYDGHLALQINIIGEGGGAFYAEILDGKVIVQPYQYFDNDAMLSATAEDLIDIVTGKLDPTTAYADGKIYIDGNKDKAFEIKMIVDSKKAAKVKKTKTVKVADKDAESKAVKKTAAKTTKAAPKKKETASVKVENLETKIDSKQLSFTETAPAKAKAPAKETVKAASKTASKTVKESAVKAAATGRSVKTKTGAKKG